MFNGENKSKDSEYNSYGVQFRINNGGDVKSYAVSTVFRHPSVRSHSDCWFVLTNGQMGYHKNKKKLVNIHSYKKRFPR